MSNAFITGLVNNNNLTARTQNGAVTNRSSLSENVDLFSKIGAVRGKPDMARSLFSKAYGQDKLTALKILFWGRDVRGGQGERGTFRAITQHLATHDPVVLRKNLRLFPEYGRWDDLVALFGTPVEEDAIQILCNQLAEDFESDTPSLAAKWTPSINASSNETRANARKLVKALGISDKEYRKALVAVRKKIGVLETQMSEKKWSEIDYSQVPSVAGIKYRRAFLRNDETRRREYLGKVEKGDAKMNTSTLYPYDITSRVLKNTGGCWGGFGGFGGTTLDQTLEEAWKNLPNYLEGNEHNAMVVCDTSASMFWEKNALAAHVATSLAVYISERNTGPYKDYFLTFNTNSRLVKLQGATLAERLKNLPWNDVGGSTNIQSAFDQILKVAVENNLDQDEIPKVLYIVSDMQFNPTRSGDTNYEDARQKFESRGYQLPKIVWWNVNASSDQPVTINDNGNVLVSGCTPNIFKQVLKSSTPEQMMLETINQDRYDPVQV